MTLLSIVIPYYNDPKNIIRCIDSISAALSVATERFPDAVQQTEMVIVDDQSPVPFTLSEPTENMTIIRLSENRGVGAVRNIGAANTSGKYILFVDSDIILEKNHIDILFEEMNGEDPPVLLQGPTAVTPANIDAGLFQRYLATAWNYYEYQNRKITVFTQCFLIRKAFFQQMGGFVEKYSRSGGEEFEFALRLGFEDGDFVRYRHSLIHFHHFDRIGKRLKKVYFRSRYISAIALEMPNLPFRFKAQAMMRSGYSFLMNLSLMMMLLSPGTGLGLYLMFFILFGLSDWSQTRHMIAKQGGFLAAFSVLFRQLEYTFINIGMVAGYLNRIRGRAEDGRQREGT